MKYQSMLIHEKVRKRGALGVIRRMGMEVPDCCLKNSILKVYFFGLTRI